MDYSKILSQNVEKRIKTTMIGSIADIEDFFSFLWDGEDTEDKQEMKAIFVELRESILNRGNNQNRAVKKEFEKYEIKPKRFNYTFNVRDEE